MGNGKVMTVIVISAVHFQFGFLISSTHTCIFIMCAFKALSFLMFVCVYGLCLSLPHKNVFPCAANHPHFALYFCFHLILYLRSYLYLFTLLFHCGNEKMHSPVMFFWCFDCRGFVHLSLLLTYDQFGVSQVSFYHVVYCNKKSTAVP